MSTAKLDKLEPGAFAEPPAAPSGTPRTDAIWKLVRGALQAQTADESFAYRDGAKYGIEALERQTQRDADRISELEAALKEAATVFDDLDTVMWDRSGCPVQYTDAQNAVNEALAVAEGGRVKHETQCPVCHYKGQPEKHETWNGIRGPGARVVSRRFNCPQCGVMFAHDAAWLEPLPQQEQVEAFNPTSTKIG